MDIIKKIRFKYFKNEEIEPKKNNKMNPFLDFYKNK